MTLNYKRFGMNYKFIYLAGPIECVNAEEREDWRLLADLQFGQVGAWLHLSHCLHSH